MSFQAIEHILTRLQNQPEWQLPLKSFQHLLKSWSEVVGETVAAQTRLISIQRGVLQVATSSSAWAQTLTLDRYRLLKQLNTKLDPQLIDIRFSTAHWHRVTSEPSNEQSDSLQNHPSWVPGSNFPSSASSTVNSQEPKVAFEQWAKLVQARSQDLPLCPQCQCPTPPGELARWQICSLCAANQWHKQ